MAALTTEGDAGAPGEPRGVAGRTTQGAAWLVGSRLVVRGVDFVLLLVLGRLLGPADFGIVAIAMTLITVVEAVLELPLVQSLISLPAVSRAHLDTAFTLGLLRGLALALVLGLLAWPFARFYHDPRLCSLILALGLAPAARGLTSPAMALYARDISFHRDFFLEIAGKLASFCVAIALAFSTHSYWALVASTTLTPISTTMISYVIAPYRPRFSLARWPDFAGFLGWSSAAQVIAAVNWQCDRFLISRNTSQATLGRFSMANDVSVLPVQALLVPLLRPLTAGFAACRNDEERLSRAYLRATNALLAVTTPVMVGLSVLAAPAVRLVLGPKWDAAAPILRWLALAAIPNGFVIPLGALAMALGRTHVSFRQGGIEFLVKIPLVVAGVVLFGIPGVIAARLLSALVMAATAMLFVRRLCGLSPMRQLGNGWRPLASGALMGAALFWLQSGSLAADNPARLVFVLPLFALCGAAVYVAASLTFWRLSGRPAGVEASALAIGGRLLASGLRRAAFPPLAFGRAAGGRPLSLGARNATRPGPM